MGPDPCCHRSPSQHECPGQPLEAEAEIPGKERRGTSEVAAWWPGEESEFRVLPPPGSLLRLFHPKAASLHNLAFLICTPVYVSLPFPSDWEFHEGRALPHQISSEGGRISPLFLVPSDWEAGARTQSWNSILGSLLGATRCFGPRQN